MKKITCKNTDDNYEITVGYTDFNPFFLVSCDGIYTADFDVSTSANTMTDGSTYQGTIAKMREIVLTVAMESDYVQNRNLLYKVFRKGAAGEFIYTEDSEVRRIAYRAANVDIDETGVVRNAAITLKCPDPFFEDLSDMRVDMAGWEKLWIFPHAFQLEPFGQRKEEKLKDIDNEANADNVGMTITFTAEGDVTNPAIYHVQEKEYIKVGTASKPLNMVEGDVLTITTQTNNKNVRLLHDGVSTLINEYLDNGSEFIQLQSGKNSLRYTADAGEDYLAVSISYRNRYIGV